MAGNPLVSGPVDTTTATSGTGLLDDSIQLSNAISNGDWVEGGMAAFSVGLDTVAAVSDPLGSLIAAGLGWLIDHFEPLKGWFDDLTGDPGEVAGFSQTWGNVATALHQTGPELTRVVGDLDDLSGDAFTAYRQFQQDTAAHLNGAGDWAHAMSEGLKLAGTIVQMVHDLVRDVISQLVGSAISWAAEVVFSFGLATPWVIEQVSTRVASVAEKIGTKLTALLNSMRKLSKVLDELRTLMSKVSGKIDGWLHGGGGADDVPTTSGGHPSTHGGDDGGVSTAVDTRPYLDPTSRPSFRKGVPESVWERAQRDSPDGVVRDPNTGEVIDWKPGDPRRGVWDMGHLPEAKYHDMWQRYVDGDLTPKEFRDWYNDPDNYRPETPSANRSHRYE